MTKVLRERETTFDTSSPGGYFEALVYFRVAYRVVYVKSYLYPSLPSVCEHIFEQISFICASICYLLGEGAGKSIALIMGVRCRPYELCDITRMIKCVVLIAYFKRSTYLL